MNEGKLPPPEHIIKSSKALVESYGYDQAVKKLENDIHGLKAAIEELNSNDVKLNLAFQLDEKTQMLNATKQ